MQFVDVIVRQAHPGPGVREYRRFEQKLRDARCYEQEEAIPWTVLVDDVAGTVHQRYGALADPTYLLDADGRVAYYNMWTYAPTLHEAIDALLARGGRGVVRGGINRQVYPVAALTDGWHGLRRGLAQSFIDLELITPGSASAIWLGYQLRPLLAPLTLRAEPLPAAARLGITAAGIAALVLGARRLAGGRAVAG